MFGGSCWGEVEGCSSLQRSFLFSLGKSVSGHKSGKLGSGEVVTHSCEME